MHKEFVNLNDGVVYKGKVYKQLLMRGPVVRDSLEAEVEAGDKGALRLAMALMTKLILKFGTRDENGEFVDEIPKEDINQELLAQLCDDDFERLHEVRDFLKKKAHWTNENSTTSALRSSS